MPALSLQMNVTADNISSNTELGSPTVYGDGKTPSVFTVSVPANSTLTLDLSKYGTIEELLLFPLKPDETLTKLTVKLNASTQELKCSPLFEASGPLTQIILLNSDADTAYDITGVVLAI